MKSKDIEVGKYYAVLPYQNFDQTANRAKVVATAVTTKYGKI